MAMRVMIIGEKPSLVDLSDPAIPPATTAEKIRAGLDKALDELRAKGRIADLIADAAASEVETAFAAKLNDCIVVGAGLRVVPRMTGQFETIVNVVRDRAPQAQLAFNMAPDDSATAAERQLSR